MVSQFALLTFGQWAERFRLAKMPTRFESRSTISLPPPSLSSSLKSAISMTPFRSFVGASRPIILLILSPISLSPRSFTMSSKPPPAGRLTDCKPTSLAPLTRADRPAPVPLATREPSLVTAALGHGAPQGPGPHLLRLRGGVPPSGLGRPRLRPRPGARAVPLPRRQVRLLPGARRLGAPAEAGRLKGCD